MFITKSVNLFGAKLKHLHEQFGSVFFIISNTKMKWIPHVFCIYLLSSQIFYIFLWKPVIFNFNLVFWVIHEEFIYFFINWILWWNFCHSVHNWIHESISWMFCRKLFMNVTNISNMKLVKNHKIKLILKQILKFTKVTNIYIDIKVGHLLSEFVIEFVSELRCRILLSKVATKVSELSCRMWIESRFRQ